ncbi:uncharacterized protein NEMAJ01_1531 [Nematocida major]|uniref:uncharacterized protein n=1 Tax=Nematocida major TaxID=1912982 RepID=UPI002007A47C|nr:uncharacterized protein NEMAJ01_1531 [Nematocida major]KAH9386635.1 hypothetical protein NEMAJ01_1531 [Nematocida major]
MVYFDCEYDTIGKDRAGVMVVSDGCRVFGTLGGPFEPSTGTANMYAGSVRVSITGCSENRIEYASVQEVLEKTLSSIIHIRDYPRCILDIKLYVVTSRESIISSIINTISVLLLNAGIQMKGVLVAAYESKSGATAGYAHSNNVYSKVLEIGECAEESTSEVQDTLERMVYSLKEDYQKNWELA